MVRSYICPLCSKTFIDVDECPSCEAPNAVKRVIDTNPGRPIGWYVVLVVLIMAAIAAAMPMLIDWMRQWILSSRNS
jgi:hypothetical protein